MQIQGAFKDCSSTKTKIYSACVDTLEAQNTENETFLGIRDVGRIRKVGGGAHGLRGCWTEGHLGRVSSSET